MSHESRNDRLTREETQAKILAEFDKRLWNTANDDIQLRMFSRFEAEAVRAALATRSEIKAIEPFPEEEAYAGTYAAGWNDAFERSFPTIEKMKRGTGGAQYVKGFNACISALREMEGKK